jgi:hypothetical protein
VCSSDLQYAYYLRKRNHALLFLKKNAFLVLYPIAAFGGELPLIWRKSSGTMAIVAYGIGAVSLYTRVVMARRPARRRKKGK